MPRDIPSTPSFNKFQTVTPSIFHVFVHPKNALQILGALGAQTYTGRAMPVSRKNARLQ